MNARPRPDARGDTQLVRAATAGDRGAFAGIYDRYADRLHDFCWGLLRDRDEAADATQGAFLVAAERLGQLRDPERLRPWLYAIARSQALRRLRARSRVAPGEEMTDPPDPAAGPEPSAERADLSQLVWEAAGGLSPRDRALLDLHLRHGLEGAELGQAMSIEPGHADVLLRRLRDQVERSLGAFLVARLGRDDCPDLSSILSGWDGRFSPLIRKRAARHVDTCEVCGPARRRLASPVTLLAAVPPAPAPALLRRVMGRVDLTAAAGSGPGDGGSGPGAAGPASAAPEQRSPQSAALEQRSARSPGSGTPEQEPHQSPGAKASEQGSPRSPGSGTPEQGSPRSPGSGAPEREGSPQPEGARAGIHSPLGATWAGSPLGGTAAGRPLGGMGTGSPPLGAKGGPAGGAGPRSAGGRRRRGTTVGLVVALLLAVGVGVGLGWEWAPAGSSPDDQGRAAPIVAGPATSVAPGTASTTTSTSPSTTTAPSTTGTAVPAAPASLVAAPAGIDLGARDASATLTLRNDGDEPLSWAADPSADWLRVRPATGRLDGGDRARLTLSAARDGQPEGDADARVDLTWGGPARSVTVALRVEHLPDISDLSATPGRIFAAPCSDDTTALVEASVADESALSSVALRWADREVPMTQRSGSWSARLGPVASPGLVPWQVVATDVRGNTAMAPGLPVRALACP